MVNETLKGIGKFIAGAMVGALALAIYNQTKPEPPITLPPVVTPKPAAITGVAEPDDRISAIDQQLDAYLELVELQQTQLDALNLRLMELEKTQQDLINHSHEESAKKPKAVIPTGNQPATEDGKKNQPAPLSVASLTEVGIDLSQADYILQRQAELDLQRLELRDQAIREGTLGSKEYVNALRELNRQYPKLREEIGEDAYDRYLYARGRNNRVVVTSVIPGSAADQAGIREGDMILHYGDRRVFTWSELRNATTQGYLGEYVTINVQRNDQVISLLAPRGPLGIRMRSSSKLPLDYPAY